MAHELDFSNNRANMAYVGEKPWHGMGSLLTADAPIETWTKEAGMDWTVYRQPLRFQFNDQSQVFDGKHVLSRSDTGAGLAVVNSNYNIVQPKEVLEFFRDLVAFRGFQLETAGCLFGGRKFWAMARSGDNFKIADGDEVAPYLLLATSCDGSMATVGHLTSIRVVCNNTLSMSVGRAGEKAMVRRTHAKEFDSLATKTALGLFDFDAATETFADNMRRLAETPMSVSDAIDLIAAEMKIDLLNEDGSLIEKDAIMQTSGTMRNIIALFNGAGKGSALAGSHGTAWGLLNAVTEHFDHHAGRSDGARAFERANLTDRAQLKVRIGDRLLALAA